MARFSTQPSPRWTSSQCQRSRSAYSTASSSSVTTVGASCTSTSRSTHEPVCRSAVAGGVSIRSAPRFLVFDRVVTIRLPDPDHLSTYHSIYNTPYPTRKMIESYKVESVAVRTRQGSSSPGSIASRGISLDRARGAWPQAPAREESAHPNAAGWASCELCFYLAPDRTSPRFLLDNGCRVEFDLSHSKQRIGVMSTRQYGEGLNERRDATIHRATRPRLSPPPLSRCIFSPSRPSNRLGRFHLTDLFQFAVADAVPRWICYS